MKWRAGSHSETRGIKDGRAEVVALGVVIDRFSNPVGDVVRQVAAHKECEPLGIQGEDIFFLVFISPGLDDALSDAEFIGDFLRLFFCELEESHFSKLRDVVA